MQHTETWAVMASLEGVEDEGVGLLISHCVLQGDSPHAGARVPPSFQDGFLCVA